MTFGDLFEQEVKSELGDGAGEPAPPAMPDPDPADEYAARLRAMDWDPTRSYRAACRALDEVEGGRPFTQIKEAVDRLREENDDATATATEEKKPSSPSQRGSTVFSHGSGSTGSTREKRGSTRYRRYQSVQRARRRQSPARDQETRLTPRDVRVIALLWLAGAAGGALVGFGIGVGL
jgi:hypothetical protein